MRLQLVVTAVLLAATPAWAQNGATVAVPPAPVIRAAPPVPHAPVAPVAPAPPGFGGQAGTSFAAPAPPPALAPNADNGGQSQPVAGGTAVPASGTAVPPDAAAVVANTWLPAGAATLGVLNKVDGSTQNVTIAPGAQATVGDLVVSVQSCLVRPADQLPDAAVFVSMQPAGNDTGAAAFRGWMIRSAPGATVVGDAGETFRLIACSQGT